MSRGVRGCEDGHRSILEAQRLLNESHLSSALADLTVSMDVAESYRMAGRNGEASAAFREAFAKLSSMDAMRPRRPGRC